MPLDGYFPPIGLNESVFTRDEADRLLKFRAFQQQPIIYVAASDTPEALRYMAKYKCDGTADDVEIQDALDEAYNAGGGTVVLLQGRYYTDATITVWSSIVLSGQGNVILRLTANAPDNTGAITTDLSSSITIEGIAIGPHLNVDPDFHVNTIGGTNITLRDLTMTTFADVGLKIENGERVTIENCKIANCQNGILLSEIGGTNASIRVKINNCYIYGNSSDGIVITSYENTVTNCTFLGNGSNDISIGGDRCVITNNIFNAPGIDAITTSVSTIGLVIASNTIIDSASNENAIDVYTDDSVISGNTIDGGGIHVVGANNIVANNRLYDSASPIAIEGSHNSILGNNIEDVTDSGSGFRDAEGIRLTGSHCTIQGNAIFNVQKEGILCDGGDYNLISGNRIHDAGYHGIRLGGACDSVAVNGNYIFNCSIASLGTYDGIHVANVSGMNHNSIINNIVRGSGNHRYGIRIDGTSANNTLVSNNDLAFSAVTAAYSDAGTGTDILGGNRT